jgi:hypothetical protein
LRRSSPAPTSFPAEARTGTTIKGTNYDLHCG